LGLRDVLINFQKSSLLASASEGVKNLLERFLLLAGGANANAGEGTKGAQQVLYVLDALKECLPLLSLKDKNSILKHFKTLLNLRQPLVTRRIMDALNFICLNSTSEVSSEALLEVLCTLSALSTSSNEISGDGMTFTARLLDAGMKKVFSLNRQMCVIKLPSVFSDLKGIMSFDCVCAYIYLFFFLATMELYFFYFVQIFWHLNMKRPYSQPQMHSKA
jgi:ribosomal RNA-processing protein 12